MERIKISVPCPKGIILFTFYINPLSYWLNIDCNCNGLGGLLGFVDWLVVFFHF